MEGEASTELQDWELLHNSDSALVNSPKSDDNSRDFQGIVAESEGMIRSDYFSLDNQSKYAKSISVVDASEEEGSVESDNPSWIDPGSETRYQRKNSAEFWSDSGSDRSDERKFGDFDSKNELGFVDNAKSRVGFEGIGGIGADSEKAIKFSEFDVKNELGFVKNEKSEVGVEGFGEIHVEGKDLGEFWSDSGGDGLVSMKFADIGKKNEMDFGDHVKAGDESNISREKVGQDGSIVELEAGDEYSSSTESVAVEEMKPKGQSDGEELKRRVVWWKVPFEVMKYCLFKVSPVWTFSMAAAVMGIVILGRKLYKMKRKTRGLELKLAVDDKKVSQFMSRATRLNEAFSVVRRVPIVRPALQAPGLNPWPVMSLLAKAFLLRPKLKIENLDLKHNFISSQYQNLISLLQSCKQSSEISQIHGYIIKSGLEHNPFILSKLLASAIQDTQYAASIFDNIQYPNLFMFNTMLRAYSISENPKQAFGVFNNLRAQGFMLDQFSFVTTLKACARESAIWIGLGIHGVLIKSGHVFFPNARSILMHFYCVCGRIVDAHQLFDEFPHGNHAISWNTLMGGYLHVSQPDVVIDLFRQFCRSGFTLSVTMLLNALSAVGDIRHSLGGDCLHGHCIKIGFCLDLNVVTALIGMYAKTGCINLGRRIFNEVGERDVVLWNCMIDKYAKVGMIEEAVALLQSMKVEGLEPNSSTLAGLLSACAAYGALGTGRLISEYVKEVELPLDAVLGTALVAMYAKCGCLEKAIDVFERIESKDVKSWTAMISGYGVHGQARKAIALFHRMEDEGFIPNEVTFLAVLSACSHGRLVMDGMDCFRWMVQAYGYLPKVEHYGCMIDLLGRAGMLEEAHNLIKSLPTKSDATAWRALLAACRVYGNIELGECVKRELVQIDNEHPTDSILLSSTYAIAGSLPDQMRQRQMKEEKIDKVARSTSARKNEEKLVKEVGISTIEMDISI